MWFTAYVFAGVTYKFCGLVQYVWRRLTVAVLGCTYEFDLTCVSVRLKYTKFGFHWRSALDLDGEFTVTILYIPYSWI